VNASPLPGRFDTASPRPRVSVPRHAAPLVSFITVAYGTGSIIVDSIASLVESLAGSDIPYEYLVVDNAHAEAEHRTCNHLLLATAGVRVVRPGHNLGFAGGCEMGVLHTSGDVLAFVNPDVLFEPGWLEPLLRHLDDPAVSIVSPVLLEPDGSVQEAGYRLFSDGSVAPILEAPGADETVRPDYASAACWVMKRVEHERLGGLAPDYFPAYYEDVDFALRAAALGGGTLVVGASTIVHLHHGSTDDSTVPDVSRQRRTLLELWPSVARVQPQPPA